MSNKSKKKHIQNSKPITNSAPSYSGFNYNQQPMNAVNKNSPLLANTAYEYITLDWMLLAQLYLRNGLAKKLVNMPVEDAFQSPLRIKSKTDITPLINQKYFSLMDEIKEALVWAGLFGGGVLIVGNWNQDLSEELNIDTDLRFKAAHRWEIGSTPEWSLEKTKGDPLSVNGCMSNPYHFSYYYGEPVHNSRIIPIVTNKAPYPVNLTLMGWGTSELEEVIVGMNQQVKLNNSIFFMVDQAVTRIIKAKDIATIGGMNTAQQEAYQSLIQQLTLFNMYSFLFLDKEDQDFQNMQLSYGGISEISKEARATFGGFTRIPVKKLFGLDPDGLSTNDEATKDYYNTFVMSKRNNALRILNSIIPLIQEIELGKTEEFQVDFGDLIPASGKEKQEKEALEIQKITALCSEGIMTIQEARKELNRSEILKTELEEEETLETALEDEANTPEQQLDSTGEQKNTLHKLYNNIMKR